jgi:hypothetical protein
MLNRTIRSHGGTQTLKDCLASIFITEALYPSSEVYLISPFLSNTPIMLNQYEQYTDLFPFAEQKMIYLSDILRTLAWKGSHVQLICNPSRAETKKLLNELQNEIEYRILENNHEKGLMTSSIYVHGSMNFTYSGIHINGESVRITSEVSEVNQALIAAKARWEEAEYVS